MKVLQVYKDYYPPVTGGIEGHINLLANGLKRKGLDVHVLVSNTTARLDRETIDGIPVTRVPQLGRFASAPLNPTFIFWLRRLGKDADILHFHFPNPTAEISCLFSGLKNKVVVSYHSDIVRQAVSRKFYAPFLTMFLKKADTIIAATTNYMNSSKELLMFRGKCKIITYGINLDKFNPRNDTHIKIDALRNIYEQPVILFIGKFRYYKGLHVLIEAMKDVKGKLLLIGTGDLEKDLRRQAAGAGLEDDIVFLGEVSDQEMVAYLHLCDLFVLPSIFRSEAFGIVQIEAMACGKPVVSTELGTGTSFVNQNRKTGLVVAPNDPAALSQAINYLIDNPDIRKAYGRAGHERVEKYFSEESMVTSTINLYKECLEDT